MLLLLLLLFRLFFLLSRADGWGERVSGQAVCYFVAEPPLKRNERKKKVEPNVPLPSQSAAQRAIPDSCVACIYYRCISRERESRTFLPAALLPSYLTFAFCLLLLPPLFSDGELGGWLPEALDARHPLESTRSLCVIDVGLV